MLVGIEIPDYVSSPSKDTILKTIQNRWVQEGWHEDIYIMKVASHQNSSEI